MDSCRISSDAINFAVKTIIYTRAAHISASAATRSRVNITLPPAGRGQHCVAFLAAWRLLCSEPLCVACGRMDLQTLIRHHNSRTRTNCNKQESDRRHNNNNNTVNRVFMKLFRTGNIEVEVVRDCQVFFNFDLPSMLLRKRTNKFIGNYRNCGNDLCKFLCTS